MFPQSHYTKAILWWLVGVSCLTLLLLAGDCEDDWIWECVGVAVLVFVCGCWSYRYAKTGGKDIQITDSLLLDAPIADVFQIVENYNADVWAIVESWRNAKHGRHRSSGCDLYYPVEDERDNPVGLTFVQIVRGVKSDPFVYTITAHDKPNHFGLQVDSSFFSGTADYKLVTVEDGTRLDYSCDISLLWFHDRISGWLTHRFMAKAYRQKSRKVFGEVQVTG